MQGYIVYMRKTGLLIGAGAEVPEIDCLEWPSNVANPHHQASPAAPSI